MDLSSLQSVRDFAAAYTGPLELGLGLEMGPAEGSGWAPEGYQCNHLPKTCLQPFLTSYWSTIQSNSKRVTAMTITCSKAKVGVRVLRNDAPVLHDWKEVNQRGLISGLQGHPGA